MLCIFLIPAGSAFGAPDWSMPTATVDHNGEYIWGYEWYKILGQLPATVKTHFVADHCFSGGIVRDLGGLGNHSGFAASNEHELSWGGTSNGGAFMDPFLDKLDTDTGTYNDSYDAANPPRSTKMKDPTTGSDDEIDYNPGENEVWKSIVWIKDEQDPGFVTDGRHVMNVLKDHGWTDENIELMYGASKDTTLDNKGTPDTSDDIVSDRAQTQSDLVNYISALKDLKDLTRLDLYLSCHGTFTDRVVTAVGNDGNLFNYQVTWGDYRKNDYGPEYFYVELGDQDPNHWNGASVTAGGLDQWLYDEVLLSGKWYARWGNTGTAYDYRDIVFSLEYTEPDPLPYLANWQTKTTDLGNPGHTTLADSSYGTTVYKNNTGIGSPFDPVSEAYLHALGGGLGIPADGLFNYPVAQVTWGNGTGYDWYYGAVTARPVPEPTTLFLLGSGLAGLFGFRRKLGK